MAKTPAQLDREISEALAGKARRHAHAPNAGARIAKTKLIHVVQGNYGYGHGWEDVTAEDTRKEALARLREYRENERGAPFRLIRRREKIEAATAPAAAHARKKKIDQKRLKQHATKRAHTVFDLVEVNTRTKKERVLHEHFSTRADAKEARDAYKTLKKPAVTYKIRSRKIATPPYRWNRED